MTNHQLTRKRDTDPRSAIATAVREARARQRLTQLEVARRAGTKQERVSEIESEKGNPKLDTLSKVIGALGLEIRLEQSAA
jgi:transcriptional regulator with XRE-family HTH domain